MAMSAPASAQDAAPSVQIDDHAALYEAIAGGVNEEVVLENMVRDVSQHIIRSSPDAAAMEAESPGLLVELMLSLRPVLRQYRQRVLAKYTPEFITVLRDLLTAQEAQELL